MTSPAGPAIAQASSGGGPAATTANNEAQSSTIGEIVVTAQRRSEFQRDVPIAITSVTAQQMEAASVKELTDITKLTPALRFDYAGAFIQPTIRGVGTAITTAGGGSNVGIYIDGFYSPNPVAANFELLNVENIQVLKGPQGTLFGRNTTGGAILVTTAEPSRDPKAVLQASYSRFNTQRYQAYGTTGFGEKVAVDLEGLYTRGDGYQRNILTNDKKVGQFENWSMRAGVKFAPTDKMSFLLRYQHQSTDDPTATLGNAFVRNGQALTPGAVFGAPVATRPNEVANSEPIGVRTQTNVWQLTSKFDFDFATLTSFTQYRDERTKHAFIDLDWSAAPVVFSDIPIKDKTFTQEFLLNSASSGRLKWTLGAFFIDYKDAYPNTQIAFGGAPLVSYASSAVDTRSYAAYGDATYEVVPNLFLTAGARYSHDQIRKPFFTNLLFPPLGKFELPNQKNDRITPRFVLRYKPDAYSSIYASYARGYKAPITNVGCGCLNNVNIAAETITSYETGYKYGRGPLSASVSAYYYDYKNLQVSTYTGALAFITNAASSRVYGLEGDLRYEVTRAFQINAGAAYTDAKFKSYPNSPAQFQCLDPVACGAGYGLFTAQPIDASGFRMPRAPKFTGNVGARYTIAGVADGELALSGNLFHSSKFFFDASNQFPQKGYTTLSLRAEWTDPSQRYTLAVFGDNVTNERYRIQGLAGGFGVGSVWNYPTTYGVSVRARL
ncbi:TonB-dependent receptor [Phenylobacterium sp. LjRoot225]|uniref:TonB-dependent receptor n=1 Tax=Phenylobacterium sp. LjRoot225 TaxID=3342285 RepID=UPI003F5012D4